MQRVNSSAVKAMGFYKGTMVVQYESGGTYRYGHESKKLFDKVLHAKSIGKSLAKIVGIHAGTTKK